MTRALFLGPSPTVALFLSTLAGCVIDADLGPSATDSSGTSTTATPSTSNSSLEGTTAIPPMGSDGQDDSTGSDDTSATAADSSSGEPPNFACPPEVFESQCDPLAQDCPPGFRCIPWTVGDESKPNATVCAPVVEQPLARSEPCEIDQDTCSDPCAFGDYCRPQGSSGLGLCAGLCDWDGADETCNPSEVCDTCADCFVGTCLEVCDPFDPQCPERAPVCGIPSGEDAFACLAGPVGQAGLGDECLFPYACANGLLCVPGDLVSGCDGMGFCCTDLCDLSDGDPGCADPLSTCFPVFGPEQPRFSEHIGACALP